MSASATTLIQLAAAAAFIVGLKRLSSPRTARSGNLIAAGGMLVAVVATVVDAEIAWIVVGSGLVLGTLIGAVTALRVHMTAMPQLVGILNGLGGAASALVAGVEFGRGVALPGEIMTTIVISIVVGAITLSGSVIAVAKLQGILSGAPITYPLQKAVNALLVLGIVAAGVWATVGQDSLPVLIVAGAAILLGVLAVLPIGGADMPVVIATLNSMSGVAAAAAGFVIESTVLIIGGALVGSSGFILTMLMTRAMNRPLRNVLFGAFGTGEGAAAVVGGDSRATSADDVAIITAYASRVLIVPGYGLAVAQAQHALKSLTSTLEARGVEVVFGVHPVAGRMPGHMNVLLAEVDIPYEQLFDLDQSNAALGSTDVALVIGANDVVNPVARDDPGSQIYGMPIIEVDRATRVVVVKRSMSPGFAGIDNPLFYMEQTSMLFADAKQALVDIEAAIAEV